MQEIVQSIGAGWFNIKIRNTNLSISYIGDGPDELLDALIRYYKTQQPQVIKFNLEELGEVYLIIDWYISLHRYKQVLSWEFEIGPSEFSKQLIEDLRIHINDMPSYYLFENTRRAVNKLQNKIIKLEKLIGRLTR